MIMTSFGNVPNYFLVSRQRLDKLVEMCRSVDNVYLALIGDGPIGPYLLERHGSWDRKGTRASKVGVCIHRVCVRHYLIV